MVAPKPVRFTSCGLEGSLSLMVIVPGRFPAAVGVKVTVIMQLLWAGTEVPHVLVWAKFPVIVMPEMASGAVPPFDNVTTWATLVVPTDCVPKLMTPGGEIAIALPMP